MDGKQKCSTCNSDIDVVLFSCHHCYCNKCLYKSVLWSFPLLTDADQKILQIVCPICNSENAYCEMKKSEIYELLQKEKEISSPKCQKHNMPLNLYCTKCENEMCEECHKIHSELFSSNIHTVIANMIDQKRDCNNNY